MREIDFKYGEYILLDQETEAQNAHKEYLSREQEIKRYCDQMIREGSVDSISRLLIMATEHKAGSAVLENTNWGGILRLALETMLMEENKEEAVIFNVKNLDQLIYVFRTMRFLHYRYQFTKEEKYKQELESLFDELNMTEIARKEIIKASNFEEDKK